MPDNPWMMLRREQKVDKLIAALDVDYGHTVSEAELNEITDERLKRCIKAAEIKTASADSIEVLVSKIRTRDAMKGDAK